MNIIKLALRCWSVQAFAALIGYALLMLCGVVHAQCTTWVYTGAPFSLLTTTGPNDSQIVPLTGTITLSAPLDDGTSTVTPVSWDFTSEDSDLSSSGPYNPDVSGPNSRFTFTTTNGEITAWNVLVVYNNGPGTVDHYSVSASTSQTGDSVSILATHVESATGPTSITGTSTVPGTWTCYVPPINPLAAQVASLQTQLTAAQAQIASLQAQVIPAPTTTSAPTAVSTNAASIPITSTGGKGALDWLSLLVLAATGLTRTALSRQPTPNRTN